MKKKKKSLKTDQKDRHVLKREKVEAEHKDQGTRAPAQHLKSGGDAFAYAILGITEEARNMKGSNGEYLGVKPELLDPKDCVDRQKLKVKRSKK